jgi:hypothetical protein
VTTKYDGRVLDLGKIGTKICLFSLWRVKKGELLEQACRDDLLVYATTLSGEIPLTEAKLTEWTSDTEKWTIADDFRV